MPSRSWNSVTRLLFLGLCAVFTILSWGSSRCPAQDKQPGDPLPIQIPGTQVEILFRWCPPDPPRPPGEVRPGDPADNLGLVKIERGFYLSEAEITQEQFKAVLGHSRLEEAQKRATKNPTMQLSQFLGDKYPVFMVTINEAIEFCEALEKALTDEKSGLVSVQVRIPVDYEWQYGCLAREQPDLSAQHFNDWPKPNDWKGFTVKRRGMDDSGWAKVNLDKFCSEVWEKILPPNFGGTQEEVVQMMRKADTVTAGDLKKKSLRIMEAFLRPAIGLDHELGGGSGAGVLKTSYENSQPTGRPNKWNLRHMHTNASEWTWKTSSTLANVNDEWERLKRGDAEFLKTVKLCKMGGDYFTTLDWKPFTAWYGVSYPYPLTTNEQENLATNANVGIRILYRTNPAPMWLVRVRSSALSGDDSKLQLARDEVIPKMARADAQTNEGRIDFYLALAKYHSGDKSGALKVFKQAKSTIAASDPFFDQYEELLRRDSVGP